MLLQEYVKTCLTCASTSTRVFRDGNRQVFSLSSVAPNFADFGLPAPCMFQLTRHCCALLCEREKHEQCRCVYSSNTSSFESTLYCFRSVIITIRILIPVILAAAKYFRRLHLHKRGDRCILPNVFSRDSLTNVRFILHLMH